MKVKEILRKAKEKKKQIAAFATAIITYLVAFEELNLLTSPYVWADKHRVEIMPYIYMWSTDYFVLLCFAMFIAFLAMFIVGYTWKS